MYNGESGKFYLLLSSLTTTTSNTHFPSKFAFDSCPYHKPPHGTKNRGRGIGRDDGDRG